MTLTASQSLRAQTYDEIKPLIDLCRAGKLFEVQEWIAASKPVNVPSPTNRRHGKPPLEIAIELGFHSLVKVLLAGGAAIETDGWYCPMDQALHMRRFDIVQLLVEYGFDPRSVEMETVFYTWDPEIMEYFIDRGAEVEEGNPLASALCSRIRTVFRNSQRVSNSLSRLSGTGQHCPAISLQRGESEMGFAHALGGSRSVCTRPLRLHRRARPGRSGASGSRLGGALRPLRRLRAEESPSPSGHAQDRINPMDTGFSPRSKSNPRSCRTSGKSRIV